MHFPVRCRVGDQILRALSKLYGPALVRRFFVAAAAPSSSASAALAATHGVASLSLEAAYSKALAKVTVRVSIRRGAGRFLSRSESDIVFGFGDGAGSGWLDGSRHTVEPPNRSA